MIFNRQTLTIFELGLERAAVYQCPLTTITFKRLRERTKIAALKMGFSPPIDLPSRIPDEDGFLSNEWVLRGETAHPIFSVYLGNGNEREFWDEPIDLLDSPPLEES